MTVRCHVEIPDNCVISLNPLRPEHCYGCCTGILKTSNCRTPGECWLRWGWGGGLSNVTAWPRAYVLTSPLHQELSPEQATVAFCICMDAWRLMYDMIFCSYHTGNTLRLFWVWGSQPVIVKSNYVLGAGIVTSGFRLDGRGVGVRVPQGARFFPLHVVQTGSGAHPALYVMGTGALTLGVKRPGA
jgi:hypothetical protein